MMKTSIVNEHGVTQQEENFAQAFIKLGQKSQALKVAYDCSKYKPQSINRQALKVFSRPQVQARIAQLRAQVATELIAQRVEHHDPAQQVIYGALQVFQHWQAIALADPRKIITVRRICCRHCHGVDHAYHWRDKDEFAQAVAEAMDKNAARAANKLKALPLPDDKGGYGFRFNEPPHTNCPHCLGEGEQDVFISDFSKLDDKERRLLKSVEVKKDGSVKVHMHDQADALANMAKALGMLVDKFKIVDPKSKEGELPALPLDPTEASRVYAEMLKGS